MHPPMKNSDTNKDVPAGCMKRLVRRLIARFRLNKKVVCEESAALGVIDFHDYADTKEGEPWHMALHTCERCGKRFFI